MSVESIKSLFAKEGLEHLIHYSDVISDTVETAAAMIGCEPAQILKTMTFIVDDKPIGIALSGDTKIDNSKFNKYFHTKAKMIPFDQVEKMTGHIPGGVSPFACKQDVKIYLDESLKRFDIVYAGGGDEHNTVEATIPILEKLSNYEAWIDVSKLR